MGVFQGNASFLDNFNLDIMVDNPSYRPLFPLLIENGSVHRLDVALFFFQRIATSRHLP